MVEFLADVLLMDDTLALAKLNQDLVTTFQQIQNSPQSAILKANHIRLIEGQVLISKPAAL